MTNTGAGRPLAERIYRALLMAYPAEFRRRFGSDMLQAVRDCRRQARTAGELRALYARVFIDLFASAGQERWLELRWRSALPRVCFAVLAVALSASLLLRGGTSHVPVGGILTFYPPVWLGALLPTVADPTLAYLLVVAGLCGLIAELSAPGTLVPGTLGVFSLAFGMMSLAALPVSYGVVAAAALALLFFASVARLGARVRNVPPTTGVSQLVGQVTRARTALNATGQLLVRGEWWTAACDEAVPAGTPVEVVGVQGLTLIVHPLAAV